MPLSFPRLSMPDRDVNFTGLQVHHYVLHCRFNKALLRHETAARDYIHDTWKFILNRQINKTNRENVSNVINSCKRQFRHRKCEAIQMRFANFISDTCCGRQMPSQSCQAFRGCRTKTDTKAVQIFETRSVNINFKYISKKYNPEKYTISALAVMSH